MQRIGIIDICRDSNIYIIHKIGERLELKETKSFSFANNYEISIPALPQNIDEFYLSLPLSMLDFRLLELPFTEKQKVLSVLPFEIDSIILDGVNSIILDGIILDQTDGKSQVLAVYVKKALLGSIIERLKTLNINPKVVTSLELNHAVKNFSFEKLLNANDMMQEERIDSAIREIRNNTINLRQGELSYTEDTERIKRYLKWTTVLSAIVILLFTASFAVKTVAAKKEISRVQGDIQRMYSEIFPVASSSSSHPPERGQRREDKNKFPGIYDFRAKVKELKDKEGYLIGISPLDLLLDLSNINRGNVTFNEIVMDREKIILRGEAAAFSDVQNIKNVLGSVLNDTNISDSKTSAQGKVLFTITARGRKI